MLVEKYRSRVVASAIDWHMMETGLEFDSPQWGRPPRRDIAIKETILTPVPLQPPG